MAQALRSLKPFTVTVSTDSPALFLKDSEKYVFVTLLSSQTDNEVSSLCILICRNGHVFLLA